MKLDPPANVAEVIAYPIREIPCPLCSTVYPTPPRDIRPTTAGENAPCRRCKGAGKIYRAMSAMRVVE